MITRSTSSRLLALAMALTLLASMGCGDSDTADTTAAPTATTPAATDPPAAFDESDFLADGITAALADWSPVMKADALFENLSDGDESNDPFVLSVRSAEHYALGHISGAHNIPWRAITDPANLATLPTDEQIVVYCYTGHTGQVAATLLRLLGYDAVNLKFGMMGWTGDEEVLATKAFAAAPDYPVETMAHPLTGAYAAPTLATGETELSEIVLARAAAFMADWSPVTPASGLFENLSDGDESNDPFIVSVRSADHYALGHIENAYNIGWKNIAVDDSLATLPTDEPIVVYCYTGHTGQVAATALALLGYDVSNMKFGMMGWTADADVLATTAFSAPGDFPVEN
jgi:rhodanese-related sulfurtransferase